MKKINRSNRIKRFIAPLVIILALLGFYLIVAWNKQLIPFSNLNPSYEPGEQIVNMKKSEAEKKATEVIEADPSKKLENSQNDTPTTPDTDAASGRQATNVLVTNAGVFNGMVSASGFATNVSESEGTCEFVFSRSGDSITKTSTTMQNPTSTSCKTVSFPVSELATTGTWSVYIRYVSSISEGKSSPTEFQN